MTRCSIYYSNIYAVHRISVQVADVESGELRTLIATRVGKAAEEVIMTTAERLLQEGRIEGRIEGRAEVLLKQFTLRFGPLPPDVVNRIQHASLEELDRWAERILTARTTNEVLG